MRSRLIVFIEEFIRFDGWNSWIFLTKLVDTLASHAIYGKVGADPLKATLLGSDIQQGGWKL